MDAFEMIEAQRTFQSECVIFETHSKMTHREIVENLGLKIGGRSLELPAMAMHNGREQVGVFTSEGRFGILPTFEAEIAIATNLAKRVREPVNNGAR